MSEVVVLVPLALSVVLVASGILKLRDPHVTRTSLDDLPIPTFLRNDFFARAFPVGEVLLGVAVLVAPAPLFLPVMWVTALLFAVYLGIVSIAARQPEPVMCNCFGTLSRSPIGATTIIRNIALVLIALVASAGLAGTHGVLLRFPQLTATSQGWLAAALLVCVAGLLIVMLKSGDSEAGQNPINSADSHERGLGSTWPIPDVEVVDWNGDVRRLGSLVDESPVLLILVKSNCAACKLVMDEVPEWIRALEPDVRVILATSTPRLEFLGDYPQYEDRTVWGYRSLVTSSSVRGVPSALLFKNRVALGPAYGAREIGVLTHRANT